MNDVVTAKAGQSSDPVKGASTVVIGCKLPHGLVMELGIVEQKVGTGTQLVKGTGYRAFVVKGANAARIVGGYGVTPGVPADFATEWFKVNANLKFVKDGLLFMVDRADAAKSEAKDRRDVTSGLEAIDPLKAGPGKPAIDAAARAAYLKQVSENPNRGRQVDELQA